MSITEDYSVREYIDQVMDINEASRLNAFLRIAGQHQPRKHDRVLWCLFDLMDHPGKEFCWCRGTSSNLVYIRDDDQSIKYFHLTQPGGLWFRFYYDDYDAEWYGEEVTREQAERYLNPDNRFVMPDRAED